MDAVPRGCVAGFVLVLLVSSGCGAGLTRRGASATASPHGTTSVGRNLGRSLPTQHPLPGGATVSTGTLVLRLTDQNSLHPAGIPLNVKGPVQRTALTDGAGIVKITGPAGRYSVRVVLGCTQLVDVSGGGYANLGLAVGQTKNADLVVRWQHRIAPSPPVSSDPESSWRVGQRVDVRYDVFDRCAEKRAPNASFETYGFTPSPGLKVIGTPLLRSDADAHAHVFVSCSKSGKAALVLRDRANPSESFDLVKESITYGPRPRCVAS